MRKLSNIITAAFLALALTLAADYQPSLQTMAASAVSTDVNSSDAANSDNPVLKLKEVRRPDLINQYTQKHYSIFDVFYNSNYTRGIFTMGQTTAGNPICYDAAYLSVSKSNGNKVYSFTGGKWKLQSSYPKNEYALRVLTWSDRKWNIKVYRYTDGATANPFKTNAPLDIKRDSAGNWYLLTKNNDKTYIYQLDEHLKVKYKVCVSDLTDSQFSNFYILKDGNVLLETFDLADTTEAWNYAARNYNNLQLINLKSGTITLKYDTGYENGGYVKTDGNFIYMRDKSKKNIVRIDSSSGKVKNIIDLSDYDYLIKPHDYSEELGTQYDYDYSVSGKYLYLLKKNGVYRIDLGNGKFRKLTDDSYKPFGIQDMRFLDFKVKNSNTFYILAVNFDSECATDFYTYTK
jgi:hypothetical protein